jgi:hypothetical protein
MEDKNSSCAILDSHRDIIESGSKSVESSIATISIVSKSFGNVVACLSKLLIRHRRRKKKEERRKKKEERRKKKEERRKKKEMSNQLGIKKGRGTFTKK